MDIPKGSQVTLYEETFKRGFYETIVGPKKNYVPRAKWHKTYSWNKELNTSDDEGGFGTMVYEKTGPKSVKEIKKCDDGYYQVDLVGAIQDSSDPVRDYGPNSAFDNNPWSQVYTKWGGDSWWQANFK